MKRARREGARETKFIHALVSVVIMAALMFSCIVLFNADPQIPLILGCLVAGIVAAIIGYSWDEMLEGMIDGIKQSLEAILILLLIGMLIGVWIASGTVPSMIYYGLSLINAQYFLVATMAICSLVAFAIGSWGTVGTIGLAFMGIGLALDLPAPVIAGCVVSGAYFGEIVSPLSDATNLTAAVVGRNVFDVVRKMVVVGAIAFVLTEVAFFVTGLLMGGTGASEVGSNVEPLLEGLSSSFAISPIALLPMAIMVVCIVLQVPAIPSMLIGSLSGVVVALFLQGAQLGDLVAISYAGYVSDTGVELIDNLLSAGGLQSMMYAISIIIIAMGFGGLMQSTGQMEALINPLASRLKGFGSLNALTTVSCVGMNVILPDQYLGISVPGQMYASTYDKRGFDRTDLSMALLGGGAVSSPLIPWNTCGIYCMGILGVGAIQYLPYAFFNLIMPILVLAGGLFLSARKRRIVADEADRLGEPSGA